jgi:NADH-quinone oxidoreductase subunit M
MWGVNYALGIDGISLFMILLTTFTMPIAILGSFRYIRERQRGFYALMLLLQTGIVGVFASMDLFLFYVFFELTLVPMYFIVGIWGGERRIYAAVKFFLYTALGSLLMLVGILYLYWQANLANGFASFHVLDLLGTPLSLTEQLWLFAAFALAFAIKVPIFPLHTWLPDAHVEAPTPARWCWPRSSSRWARTGSSGSCSPSSRRPRPTPRWSWSCSRWGSSGSSTPRWVAAVQPDAKKLVAYTSVAHMGFVVLGIFASRERAAGRAHGHDLPRDLDRGPLPPPGDALRAASHPEIEDFGGLARVAPLLATALVLTAMASIGVPGTSGFVGEFLALLGTFERYPVIAFLAALGVIFAAFYMLPMVQRVLFNKLEGRRTGRCPTCRARDRGALAPALLMIVLGVYPAPVLERMEPGVRAIVEWVEEGQTGALRSAREAHGREAGWPPTNWPASAELPPGRIRREPLPAHPHGGGGARRSALPPFVSTTPAEPTESSRSPPGIRTEAAWNSTFSRASTTSGRSCPRSCSPSGPWWSSSWGSSARVTPGRPPGTPPPGVDLPGRPGRCRGGQRVAYRDPGHGESAHGGGGPVPPLRELDLPGGAGSRSSSPSRTFRGSGSRRASSTRSSSSPRWG